MMFVLMLRTLFIINYSLGMHYQYLAVRSAIHTISVVTSTFWDQRPWNFSSTYNLLMSRTFYITLLHTVVKSTLYMLRFKSWKSCKFTFRMITVALLDITRFEQKLHTSTFTIIKVHFYRSKIKFGKPLFKQ